MLLSFDFWVTITNVGCVEYLRLERCLEENNDYISPTKLSFYAEKSTPNYFLHSINFKQLQLFLHSINFYVGSNCISTIYPCEEKHEHIVQKIKILPI